MHSQTPHSAWQVFHGVQDYYWKQKNPRIILFHHWGLCWLIILCLEASSIPSHQGKHYISSKQHCSGVHRTTKDFPPPQDCDPWRKKGRIHPRWNIRHHHAPHLYRQFGVTNPPTSLFFLYSRNEVITNLNMYTNFQWKTFPFWRNEKMSVFILNLHSNRFLKTHSTLLSTASAVPTAIMCRGEKNTVEIRSFTAHII